MLREYPRKRYLARRLAALLRDRVDLVNNNQVLREVLF